MARAWSSRVAGGKSNSGKIAQKTRVTCVVLVEFWAIPAEMAGTQVRGPEFHPIDRLQYLAPLFVYGNGWTFE
jgi:hypothetical protein